MFTNRFFYWIFFSLSELVYGAIPALYDVFEFFAEYKFFDLSSDIRPIWDRLYLLLSVLILFAITIKLINAIVNPDNLTDNKKGAKKAFMNALLAIFLVVLLPYMFNVLITVQNKIIDDHLIEKQLFGYSSSNVSPGQAMAWTSITSFIDLPELANQTAGTNHAYILSGTPSSRIFVMSTDVQQGLASINYSQPWNYTDTVDQHPVLMLLSGILIAYELIILVLDTALRSIKLGLLEIITPIILGSFIFKSDILGKWFKEYIKTYVQIFLLLIALSFLTLMLRVIPNIINAAASNQTHNFGTLAQGIINVLAIMAALRLVRQINPLINSIFGTNLQSKGGIGGRLGEMAMVGGLAQNAWNQLRTHPIQSAQRVASAPISAVGGFAAHMTAAGARARTIAERTGGTRGALLGAGALLGGFATSLGAAGRAGRQGWQNRNLHGIYSQYDRYNDTHKDGSTIVGRGIDDARRFIGMQTRDDVGSKRIEKLQKAQQAISTMRQTAQQVVMSEHSTQNADLTLNGTVVASGRAADLQRYIQSYSQSAPVRSNYATEAAFQADFDRHMRNMNNLNNQFQAIMQTQTDNAMNAARNNAWGGILNTTSAEGLQLSISANNTVVSAVQDYNANCRLDGTTTMTRINNTTQLSNQINGPGGLEADVYNRIQNETLFYDAAGNPTQRGREHADSESVKNRNPNNNGGNNNGNNH